MHHLVNKKGLSEIVSMVLLLMLTVVAVAFLFGIVNNFTGSLAPEFNCLENQITGFLTITTACYDAPNEQVMLSIQRSFDDSQPLNYIEFSINSDSDSLQYGCGVQSGFTCYECVLPAPGIPDQNYFFSVSSLSGTPQLISVQAGTCILAIEDIEPSC